MGGLLGLVDGVQALVYLGEFGREVFCDVTDRLAVGDGDDAPTLDGLDDRLGAVCAARVGRAPQVEAGEPARHDGDEHGPLVGPEPG